MNLVKILYDFYINGIYQAIEVKGKNEIELTFY